MVVVLVLPVTDHDLRVQQRVEAVDVQVLVTDPATVTSSSRWPVSRSAVIGPLGEPAYAFPGVFIDDGADLDPAALLVGVELEVHGPHHVGCVRPRRIDGRGSHAFASASLRYAEALVAPEALDLLVVHDPALGAPVVVRASVPVPGIVLRPGAQPVPRRPVRIRNGVAPERRPVRGT